MTTMPKMTRAHFRLIADIINDMPDHAPTLRAQKTAVARAFAAGLRKTNPAFDASRFITAALSSTIRVEDK
jgi:hypothetical protein